MSFTKKHIKLPNSEPVLVRSDAKNALPSRTHLVMEELFWHVMYASGKMI